MDRRRLRTMDTPSFFNLYFLLLCLLPKLPLGEGTGTAQHTAHDCYDYDAWIAKPMKLFKKKVRTKKRLE